MKYYVPIALWLCTFAVSALGHGAKNLTQSPQVTIQTIDSDRLVGQFWNPNPSPVEAIALKRRQRAKNKTRK